MTIFTSYNLGVNSLHNPLFGVGILPSVAELVAASVARTTREVNDSPSDQPRKAGHTAADAAWHMGFSLTYSAPYGEVVRPIGLDGPELEAFLDGAAAAELQTDADMQAAWDMDSPENDDAETEERYLDTLALCGERD